MSSSKAEFDKYASQGFNRIPLMREVLADLGTPLSVYLQARARAVFLFVRIRAGRGEVGPLLHHRPAGAHAAARQRPRNDGREGRPGPRTRNRHRPARHRARLQGALHRARNRRPCRASPAGSWVTSATRRFVTSSRVWAI